MLFLILHPDVQRKAREEIDLVTGQARTVRFADHGSLPYLQATIHEIFRAAAFTPFLLPHKTTSEGVELSGYVLPKGGHIETLRFYFIVYVNFLFFLSTFRCYCRCTQLVHKPGSTDLGGLSELSSGTIPDTGGKIRFVDNQPAHTIFYR